MAEAIANENVLARTPGTLWRQLLDGVVVLAAGMDEPMRLSQPADVLWQLLEQPQRFDDLVDALAERFAAEATVIAGDIEPVLQALIDGGALTCTPQR